MRVLFLNYEFPPIGGGGANATAYLFREYSRQAGLEVDCVTSAWETGDQIEQLSPNIRLIRLDVRKRDLHFWTQREILTWLARSRKQVKRLVAENDYDVCHAFFGFPSGLVAWLQRENLPYVVSLRGSDVPGFNPRFAAQYVVLKPIFKRIWHAAAHVIANSEGLKRLAENFTPQLPIGVIPNGIDTEEFIPAADGEPVPGRILCVSRLVARKGVQDLVEAMPAVLQRVPHAHLVIVGAGDLLGSLTNRCREMGITDKVDFRGYLAHEDLPALYCSADLFVQPSFYEGMSNTVLEAMASGLPIVATGEGGREELLGANAMMAPYGRPAALAESIATLLSDEKRRASMSAVSRTIAERYSWSNVAQDYLALYESMRTPSQGS